MESPLICPSAQPDMPGATILGVRTGPIERSRIAYLVEPTAVSDQLLKLAEPLKPTEVFRFAAHCEEAACRHFDGAACSLAARVVQILPAVVETLPPCKIRGECRWYRQEGRPACLRCPQVITYLDNPSAEFRLAATPR